MPDFSSWRTSYVHVQLSGSLHGVVNGGNGGGAVISTVIVAGGAGVTAAVARGTGLESVRSDIILEEFGWSGLL